MPWSLTKEWLEKPVVTYEGHWASPGAVEQVGSLLSSGLGRSGWHLLGNDSLMTCQSTYTEALVPSVNHSASDNLVDILSGMAFSHASTPNAASRAARHEQETQPCDCEKSKRSNTTVRGCQVLLSSTTRAGHRAVVTAHKHQKSLGDQHGKSFGDPRTNSSKIMVSQKVRENFWIPVEKKISPHYPNNI